MVLAANRSVRVAVAWTGGVHFGQLVASSFLGLAVPAMSKPTWTDEKNARRCDLIDKEIDGRLTLQEAVELARLQSEMLAYRRRVAPLPIGDARRRT